MDAVLFRCQFQSADSYSFLLLDGEADEIESLYENLKRDPIQNFSASNPYHFKPKN